MLLDRSPNLMSENQLLARPDTIRAIAEKFDSIARDPQASQSVHFDAARAALNLYQQAQKYEEQFGGGPGYTDETRPDMGNAPSVR